MGAFIVIIFFMTILVGLQVFLSYRVNRIYGLIIPILHLVVTVTFACMLSDLIVALLAFLFLMLPVAVWLGVYKICRTNIELKNQNEINRMKINDL